MKQKRIHVTSFLEETGEDGIKTQVESTDLEIRQPFTLREGERLRWVVTDFVQVERSVDNGVHVMGLCLLSQIKS